MKQSYTNANHRLSHTRRNGVCNAMKLSVHGTQKREQCETFPVPVRSSSECHGSAHACAHAHTYTWSPLQHAVGGRAGRHVHTYLHEEASILLHHSKESVLYTVRHTIASSNANKRRIKRNFARVRMVCACTCMVCACETGRSVFVGKRLYKIVLITKDVHTFTIIYTSRYIVYTNPICSMYI